MRLEEELAKDAPSQDTFLTIGVFDGVHRGHQYLLDQLKGKAWEGGRMPGVVTFTHHPRKVLSPQSLLPFLITLEDRKRLLRELGIPLIVPLTFSKAMARLTARDFLQPLGQYLRMRGLVVGEDFALGRGREGGVPALKKLAPELGFELVVVAPYLWQGQVVSSTAIRQALAQGEMALVRDLLGRPFSLSGPVVEGRARGRELGFPTANLDLDPNQALPAYGVYATRAYVDGQTHPAVTNIGLRPTFGEKERTVEVHLLDFHGDLLGQELRIELLARLREERRFSDPQGLRSQIEKDIAQARELLAHAV